MALVIDPYAGQTIAPGQRYGFTEMVSVDRHGANLGILIAAVDPGNRKLYLGVDADVLCGDVVGIRGYSRRIIDPAPEVWLGGGVVATYEDAPAYLPDLGALRRPVPGTGKVDDETGEIVAPTTSPVWSGPCSVAVSTSAGTTPEVGEQEIAIMPFVITVPLDVINIEPGDLFTVTQSRDQRLLVRTLVVSRVHAGSDALVRQFYATDNQD